MEQEIIVKRNDYYTETEDRNISKLKIDFRNMHFSTYDTFRNYLHIQVGEYDDLNFYLEISPYEAEEMFLELAEKAGKIARGF
ncbi:hypothetical protein [Mesobacillus zeae]|uniref:Uncharacterized protein n=1 Tax=Mesobacillus zeae TaxID=1917180 RepID=A0A398B7Z3_9BACI|nr:hypothetical protein [Mesobacillus zeae]RID85631.1 hypothetical protein D1970_08735 [Mesobacillus zeae]